MSETPPSSLPGAPDAAMPRLAATAAALDTARADVERLKRTLVEQLPRIADRGAARRFAVDAYWAFPDIPTEPLAEMATGLQGRRATYAFTNGVARRDSHVPCTDCGAWIEVDSRDELRKLTTRGSGICLECRPPSVPNPASIIPNLVTNPEPDGLTREVLQAHIRNGAPAWLNLVVLTGGENVLVAPEILDRYLRDPDDGAAAALGVGKADYLAWLESGGGVQCDARTKAGARCRNTLYGGWGDGPADWVKRRAVDNYCTIHGGPSLREQPHRG